MLPACGTSQVSETRKNAHIWDREEHEWYLEENWVSSRLFDVEKFKGMIWDPACGSGRVTASAREHGYPVHESDLIDRGCGYQLDFLTARLPIPNIAANPPFKHFKAFALHALRLAEHKVALLWQVPRLNAAGVWLEDTPLQCVWFLTPRPSMPPGKIALAKAKEGKRPSGGTVDYCWLVWDKSYIGTPEIKWLHRDLKK